MKKDDDEIEMTHSVISVEVDHLIVGGDTASSTRRAGGRDVWTDHESRSRSRRDRGEPVRFVLTPSICSLAISNSGSAPSAQTYGGWFLVTTLSSHGLATLFQIRHCAHRSDEHH